MRIENIELFYLAMPEILDEVDGSQDSLIVKVEGGGFTGWGECETSPLTSIANFVCPKSHGAANPVRDSIIDQELNNLEDIKKIIRKVKSRSLMIAQTPHTFSGIEVAILDLLAKKNQCPIYELLGYKKSIPKLAYASVLFGNTPEETLQIAKKMNQNNFKAVKFGWQNFGLNLNSDKEHLVAAREGLDKDSMLMIDVGAIWGNNINEALKWDDILSRAKVTWLEEPFYSDAFFEYSELARQSSISLAGGESCHSVESAKNLIRYGGVKYIQIDAGIAGGIIAGKEICEFAEKMDVQYVNHTFTSHLQLSASLQAYTGSLKSTLAEYPMQLKPLAWDITENHILKDDGGYIITPAEIGHGMKINEKALDQYKMDVEILINSKRVF
ncbi:mandelate racemase/muconate lactonizing enzyme family protein [Alphaproteobacteria bacterium]|nr:mandelate racemase/muconate lactonizing enzyme family protein [Alphaproteobacteria bacterium]